MRQQNTAQNPSQLASPPLSRQFSVLNRCSTIPAAQGTCWLRFWHCLQDKYKFSKSSACCLHNPLTFPLPQLRFSAFFSPLASLLF